MNKFLFSIVTGAMLTAVSISGAVAYAPTSIATPERVSSQGPLSFQMFCMLNPAECRPGGASKISLTQDVMTVLERVNARVNRSIRPKQDSAAMQIWQINPRAGDCKSYVVSKRHELIEAGLPASALRIAFVNTRAGEGHAVLVVKTSRGDLTLDNLTGEIKQFRESGHRLVSIAGADPRRWS
ncbi:Predicted transglutaminase-like cysteine proteinase [Devosia sp. YR412]|uniref:transglutaminase-like cysteine peptidase n=1 Tax=Devosia sp. YR412 TaxID=1881030 RepID=UPI0008D6C490|nr:transglutaminase-like cysteine peptidase [Devosia sp. YR412]SEP95522.1 Predicted transglutaminase-like cysteine proteinase [Devosia sp. YR412]